jgi:hypothetical protein
MATDGLNSQSLCIAAEMEGGAYSFYSVCPPKT